MIDRATSRFSALAGAVTLALAVGAVGALGACSSTDADANGPADGPGGGGGGGGPNGDADGGPQGDPDGGSNPVPGPIESADDPPPAPLACTKTVGTGSGTFQISQAALGLVPGDVVCIKGGDYDSFEISNITGTKASPITIQNDGVVRVAWLSSMSDLKHVVLSGAGKGATAAQNGIYFKDVPYRALHLEGRFEGLTLQYIDMINVADNAILFKNEPRVSYDGTDATIVRRDIRILHMRGTNTNAFLAFDGEIYDGVISNATKGVEVAYSRITDSPNAGSSVWLGRVWGANVHHNRFEHLSLNVPQHTALVMLIGDGHVHHNYFRDFLGNGMRLWPIGLGAVGSTDVYNNVFLESQKYSALEIQGFEDMINANEHTHPVNLRVFNNTAGNMNLGEKLPDGYDLWYGAVVDSYGYFGCTVEITNNLGFNINNPKHDDHIVNYQGSGSPTVKTNLYFPTWTAAGLTDATSGKLAAGSPAIGKGTPVAGLTDDHFGNPRAGTPDVGAHQR